MILSVVICTHNPRKEPLDRTLAALKVQTLPREQWELLVVDNASNPPLATTLDLTWHPKGRLVVESDLGILPGRVRGMKETTTPFILFVDDDNVLAPDYLEQALAISDTHPFLGVWGGAITLEYETPPPPWIDNYKHILASVDVPEDRWSNLRFESRTTPPTAGMCLRRSVADAFIHTVANDPRRQLLGRRGKNGMTNCEDTDLALTACDIGLGTGQFARLQMIHLIPKSRLNEDYIIRLLEGTYFSSLILNALRGHPPQADNIPPLRGLFGKIRRRLFWNRRQRINFENRIRAKQRACEVIASWNKDS